MSQKQILIGVGVILALAVGGGGYWLWQKDDSPKASQTSGRQTVGDHIIPLNQRTAETSSNGGLSVNSGSTGGLGQLNNQSQDGAQGSQSGGASGGGIDPSKFGEYEKYKDGASGLFADVEKGNGTELTQGKKAAMLYKGWLTNGQVFDQSKTGSDGKLQPFVFQLGAGQVIPGWEQTVAGMKVGGARLLIVPPVVGYGAQGQGSIPPNSVLVFLVQLVAVE